MEIGRIKLTPEPFLTGIKGFKNPGPTLKGGLMPNFEPNEPMGLERVGFVN